jgi:hypothetical protein
MKTRYNFMLDKEKVEGLDKMLQGTKYNRSSWLNEMIENAIKTNSLSADNRVWAREQLLEVTKILNRMVARLK